MLLHSEECNITRRTGCPKSFCKYWKTVTDHIKKCENFLTCRGAYVTIVVLACLTSMKSC